MYRITEGSTHDLIDIETFINTLNTLNQHPMQEVRTLFDRNEELIVTRAPGRLDVMGGIADYSGSLVLQLPIREATCVALQHDPDRKIRLVSLGSEKSEPSRSFEMSMDEFELNGRLIEYDSARRFFKTNPSEGWAGYVAGAFLVLMHEKQVSFNEGVRILIHSDVPEGKGVSSSAALEVAVMQAVVASFGVKVEPREMALLCQRVENLIVGAPCGVMDQITAVCGEKNRLLALLCQPAELQGFVDIPEEVAFWGIDSGVRHSVSGADYSSIRIGAFMGYRMIAEYAGLKTKVKGKDDPLSVTDPRWNGYLANITPSQFESEFAEQIPEQIGGTDFIAQFGNTTDSVTRIEPKQTYAVKTPTAHPIYEHFRVKTFSELLSKVSSESRLALLGELMVQSHVSYSACGLGSEGTDRLVDLVMAAGKDQGLYGAKITGGGSGGTVAVIGRSDAVQAVEAIAEQYSDETGHQPVLFRDSSFGADAFGYLRLKPTEAARDHI